MIKPVSIRVVLVKDSPELVRGEAICRGHVLAENFVVRCRGSMVSRGLHGQSRVNGQL